jgi:cytochrome c oxidase cbb3-type subunit III
MAWSADHGHMGLIGRIAILEFCMRIRGLCLAVGLFYVLPVLAWQVDQPTPQPRQQPHEDAAAVGRGRALFKSSCGFCHGNDATGSRAPDLVRSAIVSHDDEGNLLAPVIRNGRPDKGMPSFSTLKDDQIADIVAFLHHQAKAALQSAEVPGDYPLAKLLTGDAKAGKAFFDGPGGCSKCHSVSGDLSGIAKKYSPVDLQQQMVYPSSEKHPVAETAVVKLKDGTRYEGTIKQKDEFLIGIICQDGWYRSWPRKDVEVQIHDPLQAHRELMNKYTDADIHNLFAYLETLK